MRAPRHQFRTALVRPHSKHFGEREWLIHDGAIRMTMLEGKVQDAQLVV